MASDIQVTGRLVKGHPMIYTVSKDKKTGKPKTKADGITLAAATMFICIAVPKGGEQHWNETEWGKLIWAEGQSGYPQGQWQLTDFSWKVIDGDSTEMNSNMTKPCDQEGYPGNWIVTGQTTLAVKCYIHPKYNPMDVVTDPAEIKTGDYCWVLIHVVPNNLNGPVESPGVYLNPYGFSMMRKGEEIVTGANPAAIFANASAPSLPVGIPPAPVAPPVTPPDAPNMNFLNPPPAPPPPPPPEPSYLVQGQVYTKSQLLGFKWTEEQIAAYQPSTGADVPF